jgi:hypothetical protein
MDGAAVDAPYPTDFEKESALQSVIYFILVPMVYIACAIFLVGIIVKNVKIWQYPKPPTTLQIFPEKNPRGCGCSTIRLCFRPFSGTNHRCGSF